MAQTTTLQTLTKGILLENTYYKNFRSPNYWIPYELQTILKNKDITLPTNYHLFQLKYLPQV